MARPKGAGVARPLLLQKEEPECDRLWRIRALSLGSLESIPCPPKDGHEINEFVSGYGNIGPTEEESNRSFKVYIDAHSGRLLSYWEGHKSGGFGAGKIKRRAPFAWDIGPATLTLGYGKKSLTVANAQIPRVGAKTFTATRTNLILTLARFTFRADYDAKQGILRQRTPCVGRHRSLLHKPMVR